MTAAPVITSNQATAEQIDIYLQHCDNSFVPPLIGRVAIGDYARKIVNKAERFEAWAGGRLIGLVAAYCNDSLRHIAFITSVSVLPEFQRQGIASQLIIRCIDHVLRLSYECIELEVDNRNTAAMRIYERHGFLVDREASGKSVIMNLAIRKEM